MKPFSFTEYENCSLNIIFFELFEDIIFLIIFIVSISVCLLTIIFEPNKLNPLIWLTHLIDKNERGLLNVGTLDKYNKILNNFHLKIIHHRYSGIVIGPSSKIFDLLSSILNYKLIYPILGWFNPKIMLVAKK